MDVPEERVQIAIAESGLLKQYLAALSPDAWDAPSACDRWVVRDVVAHLAAVAEAYIPRIHQSLGGEGVPADGSPPPGPNRATAIDGVLAEGAVARSKALGSEVLSDFVAQNDELIRLMQTLSGDDWDLPHYYSTLGTLPMRYRPVAWVSELALHGWDIRSRLEPASHLSDKSLPVVVDLLPGTFTNYLFNPRPQLARPVRYRWELTGPGARNSDVEIDGEQATVVASGSERADVTFRCDTETFALISWGRLKMEAAKSAGRITIDGDSERAMEFQQWFPHG